MRRVRMIAEWLLALVLLLVIGIHVYAEVFRWRAEHLLAQLKTFRLEETPAATVLKLRSEYDSSVTDHGPYSQHASSGSCSEDHCTFWIGLTEWNSLIMLTAKHPWSERPRDYLVGGLRFFGLRLNSISANLHVEKGKLRSVDVWFIPMSYRRNGFLSDFSI
ncbi:MAG TPA: hypothetical protein VF845_12825, partial [Terriglobales bacterium]